MGGPQRQTMVGRDMLGVWRSGATTERWGTSDP